AARPRPRGLQADRAPPARARARGELGRRDLVPGPGLVRAPVAAVALAVAGEGPVLAHQAAGERRVDEIRDAGARAPGEVLAVVVGVVALRPGAVDRLEERHRDLGLIGARAAVVQLQQHAVLDVRLAGEGHRAAAHRGAAADVAVVRVLDDPGADLVDGGRSPGIAGRILGRRLLQLDVAAPARAEAVAVAELVTVVLGRARDRAGERRGRRQRLGRVLHPRVPSDAGLRGRAYGRADLLAATRGR